MWDLNPRLPEPQSGALPTELIPPQGTFLWYQGGASGANARDNRTHLSEKEQSMRVLILCAAFCAAAAFAGPQESGLTASARAAIEKAVLEVNAQMTRAAEDRDIDRLFSFMLRQRSRVHHSERQSLPDPRRGPRYRQAELPGRRRHQVPLEAATGHRDLPHHRAAGVRRGIRDPHRPGPARHLRHTLRANRALRAHRRKVESPPRPQSQPVPR